MNRTEGRRGFVSTAGAGSAAAINRTGIMSIAGGRRHSAAGGVWL